MSFHPRNHTHTPTCCTETSAILPYAEPWWWGTIWALQSKLPAQWSK